MLDYNKNNKSNARNLRKNMTPWERKLWFKFLTNFPVKFVRQKSIGEYIVDFYCANKKLAIELDGSQHYNEDEILYDNERTKYLNSVGVQVCRYTNLDIDKRFKNVCEDIYNKITTP